MFIGRVVLGHAYVSQHQQQFSKPPCTTCFSDRCVRRNHRSSFDSVVATHKDAGGTAPLMFREFVIYDLSQSYPEFLVKYERK